MFNRPSQLHLSAPPRPDPPRKQPGSQSPGSGQGQQRGARAQCRREVWRGMQGAAAIRGVPAARAELGHQPASGALCTRPVPRPPPAGGGSAPQCLLPSASVASRHSWCSKGSRSLPGLPASAAAPPDRPLGTPGGGRRRGEPGSPQERSGKVQPLPRPPLLLGHQGQVQTAPGLCEHTEAEQRRGSSQPTGRCPWGRLVPTPGSPRREAGSPGARQRRAQRPPVAFPLAPLGGNSDGRGKGEGRAVDRSLLVRVGSSRASFKLLAWQRNSGSRTLVTDTASEARRSPRARRRRRGKGPTSWLSASALHTVLRPAFLTGHAQLAALSRGVQSLSK